MFNPNQIYNLDENEKCNNCHTQYCVNGYQLSYQNIQNMLMRNTHQKQRKRNHSKINGATTTTRTTTKSRTRTTTNTGTRTTSTTFFFSFKVTNLVLNVGELSELQLVSQMLSIHI